MVAGGEGRVRNPDHLFWPAKLGKGLECRTFLPFYDIPTAPEADKKGLCKKCDLGCYRHPLLDTGRPHEYHLLCTLYAIKAGVLTRHEVTGSK